MILAFWSPFHGQTATTTTTALMATGLALEYGMKVLMAHTNGKYGTLEQCFLEPREEKDWIDQSDSGLWALKRLAENHQLSPALLPNYTKSLYQQGTLDLLQGYHQELPHDESSLEWLEEVLLQANQAYELVCLDIPSGLEHNISQLMLAKADLVIVCLNQNKWLLEAYHSESPMADLLSKKAYLVHLANAQMKSRYTPKNVQKIYGYPKVIQTPYLASIVHASNQSQLLSWYMRKHRDNKMLDKKEAACMKKSLEAMVSAIKSVHKKELIYAD